MVSTSEQEVKQPLHPILPEKIDRACRNYARHRGSSLRSLDDVTGYMVMDYVKRMKAGQTFLLRSSYADAIQFMCATKRKHEFGMQAFSQLTDSHEQEQIPVGFNAYVEDTVAQQIAEHEARDALNAFFKEVDPRVRKIVNMRLKDMTFDEIAQIMGISAGYACALLKPHKAAITRVLLGAYADEDGALSPVPLGDVT